MKEIKSKKYMSKIAIYSDLPFGDPGLPGNLEEKDIPGSISPNEVNNQKGETDVVVDWNKFLEWFSADGNLLPDFLKNKINTTISDINISFTYNYDYNNNEANNINVISVTDYENSSKTNDSDVCVAFGDYYRNQIIEDIEMIEENNKSDEMP